jgi:hypothetical protein
MSYQNNFDEQLEISKGIRGDSDLDTIKRHILGAQSVNAVSNVELDKKGVDFVVTLRNGAELYIDLKSRETGASKYWKNNEPELALEVFSVVETKTAGWTLDEAKVTDYIYYTFADIKTFYLIPFQLLRIAFRRNFTQWQNTYKIKQQKSHSNGRLWTSSAIFVPASIVLDAVKAEMEGTAP